MRILEGFSQAARRVLTLLLVLTIVFNSAPSQARFISPDDFDPTLPGVGTNRYAYAQNDPINKSDPNGHAIPIISAIIAFFGALLGGTDDANAPGPDDRPSPTSDSQMLANSAAGALAGVKVGTLAGSIFREAVKKSKKGQKEEARREALQEVNIEVSNTRDDDQEPAPKPPHRNKLDERPATLYEKYDKDGNFEKHGITHHDNPENRYSKKEIDRGRVDKIERGPRIDMAKKERDRVEINPGPKNNEPWAGKRRGGPV